MNWVRVDGRVKLYAGTQRAHLFESDDLGESWREGKLGWVEGKNIIIVYRFAEGKVDRLSALAADLVGQSGNLSVARGEFT